MVFQIILFKRASVVEVAHLCFTGEDTETRDLQNPPVTAASQVLIAFHSRTSLYFKPRQTLWFSLNDLY
jgi:hypothetical protein